MKQIVAVVAFLCLAACTPVDDTLPTLAVFNTAPPMDVPFIAFWGTQSGQLDATRPQASVLFNAQAGDAIRLGVVEEGAPVQMTLSVVGGDVLASAPDIALTLPQTATYRVDVQSSGITRYTIGLSYTDRPDPNVPTAVAVVVGVPTPTLDVADRGALIGEITPTLPTQGAITAQSPRHIYSLALTSGRFFTLTLARLSGTLDPLLAVYDPSGALIGQDDNAGGNRSARLLNLRADSDGIYQIQASADDTFGEYVLTVLLDFQNPTPDAVASATPVLLTPYVTPTVGNLAPGTRLTDHVAALGSIETASGFQQFALYADAGDVVTLGVAPFGSSGLRPTWDLYDPDGVLLASAQASTSADGGNATRAGIPITLSGAHLVIVSGEDGSRGAFSIAYGEGTSRLDLFRGEALPGARLTSVLTPRAIRDVWTITLQAGDVITAAASSSDGTLDPFLEVTTLDGIVLASDDNGGGATDAVLRTVTINTTARYLLRVRSARGDQTGNYTLVWRYINLSASPTPVPNQTALMVSTGIVTDGAYAFFPFYGLKGQTVRVQVLPQAGSVLDGVAVLQDAGGNGLASGDDDAGLNPDFTTILPNDGTYTVRVNGYLTAGAFVVQVWWLYR